MSQLLTVLVVIAVWYVWVPFVVWRRIKPGSAWQAEPFDPARHNVPAETTEFLGANIDRMLDAGFQVAGDLVNISNKGVARFALLTNADDVVATVVVFSTRTGKKAAMVEFTAMLPSGMVLDVNNSMTLPGFAARPEHVVYRFPQVRDPLRLFRIYQVLLRRDFGSPTLVRQDLSDPVRYTKQATEREYQRQVATGYYRFDPRTRQYSQTLKGGYLMAWKVMTPIKQIRMALLERRSRALLEEIGLAGEDQRPVGFTAG